MTNSGSILLFVLWWEYSFLVSFRCTWRNTLTEMQKQLTCGQAYQRYGWNVIWKNTINCLSKSSSFLNLCWHSSEFISTSICKTESFLSFCLNFSLAKYDSCLLISHENKSVTVNLVPYRPFLRRPVLRYFFVAGVIRAGVRGSKLN